MIGWGSFARMEGLGPQTSSSQGQLYYRMIEAREAKHALGGQNRAPQGVNL